MASDRVVINVENRARQVAKEKSPRGDIARSEDAVASAFLARQGPEYRRIGPRCRWIKWGRKRRFQDFTGSAFALIRKFVLQAVRGTKDERGTATAACDTGDVAPG
jgi:hypothetical protein